MAELKQNLEHIVDTIDVEPQHLQMVRSILARYLPYKVVWAYGSRVKWTANERSDLDLVVFDADSKDIAIAREAFEESAIPFIVQILSWETIPEDFKQNIERQYYLMQREDDWGELTIADIADFHNNKRRPVSSVERQDMQGVYPYYGASGVVDHVNNFIFDGEYVLISEDGENLNSRNTPIAFKASGKFWVNNHAHILKGKLSHHNDILIYYFQNLDLSPYITGAVQPKLSKSSLEKIPIILPKDNEQEAIAEVLSSLDDKIDLLHRQNKTLESLAETLFRHHFIENADDSWEEKPLDEIALIQNGCSFKSSDFTKINFDSYEVLKMGHIEKGGGLRSNPKKDFVARSQKLEKWVLDKNDIIMAMTDMKDNVVILGMPALIDKSNHYVLNQRVARIVLKDNSSLVSQYFLYLQLKDPIFVQELQSKANSGVQVNLTTAAIKESKILIPSIEIQSKFVDIFNDIFIKLDLNTNQIQKLEKTRDTLLPKLMSGEIRVRYDG